MIRELFMIPYNLTKITQNKSNFRFSQFCNIPLEFPMLTGIHTQPVDAFSFGNTFISIQYRKNICLFTHRFPTVYMVKTHFPMEQCINSNFNKTFICQNSLSRKKSFIRNYT